MKQHFTPVDEMFDMFRELDGLFKRTLGRREEFYFPVECFTKDKQIVFRAELPGVDPGLTEVHIVGDQLVIKGEKRENKKVEDKDLFFQEIARGRFERRFTLPPGVKKDQVKAIFDNGVLEVMVPAESLETARKVPIEIVEGVKKGVRAA